MLFRSVEKGAALVVLGTGEAAQENACRDAENRHHGLVSANIMYSDARAMAIYSGADMVLMPSKSEPCGLTQMIAMRYGTIPIVRCVGGLHDTVRNYRSEESNGFTFGDYTPEAMLGAIDDALNTFTDKKEWKALQKRAMTQDLSWTLSAEKYIELYSRIIG